MPQPQRVTDLMQGYPAKKFGGVRIVAQAGWHIRADKDVRAAVVAADGVPAKDGATAVGT